MSSNISLLLSDEFFLSFQLYVLKLLKMQTKYLGRQWRKSNMKTMSAIYTKVRHRLNDDWAYGNGQSNEFFCFWLHFPTTHFPLSDLCYLSLPQPTCFHDWGLVTGWRAQLITSNYYPPSTQKD